MDFCKFNEITLCVGTGGGAMDAKHTVSFSTLPTRLSQVFASIAPTLLTSLCGLRSGHRGTFLTADAGGS